MSLVLLLAALVGWWAWRRRDAQAFRVADVAAVVAAIVGLRLLSRGAELQALVALGGAGTWLYLRARGGRRGADMSPAEARRLLDVRAGASGAEVRAAHRRLVARVHPDAGGSAELAARVNLARDTLLGRIAER